MISIHFVCVLAHFLFSGDTHAIQDFSAPTESDGEFRVFITEEPVGRFCPTKSITDPISNKTKAICLVDPDAVHLIVNWEFVSRKEVYYAGSNWDWVGLYEGYSGSHYGDGNERSAIEWKWTAGQAKGSTKASSTTFFGQQLRVNLTSDGIRRAKSRPGNCLPFYAVYNRWSPSKQRYEVASIRCHRIYPDWMERSWTYLESFSLNEILIPGTHDAGSASMLDPLASPFTRTQSLGFYRQLLYGVRYFDIRVALDPKLADKFRIVHNVFWAETSISGLLDDVARFLSEFKKEFVILDFHSFLMGMTNRDAYRDLLILIETKLGHLWIPFEDKRRTLGVLESVNKRVAVAWKCAVPSVCSPSSFHPRPWEPIPHVWPNTRSITKLKGVLRKGILKLHDGLWVAQPIFTPVKILNNIQKLFPDYEWLNMNIVAVDFYQSNLVTELAEEINYFRWKLVLNGGHIS